MTNDMMRRYLGVVRHWWWLLIISTIIPAGLAYYLLSGEPEMYQAKVTLVVGTTLQSANPDPGLLTMSNALARAYGEMARRRGVTQSVIDRLGLQTTPDRLAEQIATRVRPEAQLLEITVVDINPEVGALIANTVAEELIKQTPGTRLNPTQREFSEGQMDDLRLKIMAMSQDLDRERDSMVQLTSAAEIADAEQRISALERVQAMYQSTYASLLNSMMIGHAPNILTVIEPARPAAVPISQKRTLKVGVAGLAGLMLSIGSVMLMEYFDDRIRWEGWGQEPILGLPVYGAIPLMTRGKDRLVAWEAPESYSAEAIRALRTSVHLSLDSRPSTTLLIASPSPQDGKSMVIANLAAAMASQGHRVLLIDGDLRVPRLQDYFDTPITGGLTELLSEAQNDPSAFVVKTHVPNLSFIPAGARLTDPTLLLASSRFRGLLQSLKEKYDLILIDGPAVLVVPDSLVLSALADGVLLLVDVQNTSQRASVRAKNLLIEQGKGNVIGIVLNRVKQAPRSYYYGTGRKKR
jgi:capsular exopolysaccharide synthesis family protein